MNQLQTVSQVRQRGQLTIPDIIRKNRDWVTSGSVVTIFSDKADEIVIKPHSPSKKPNWEKLWKQMKRVRAFKGKNKKSLSSFIAEDRLKGHSV